MKRKIIQICSNFIGESYVYPDSIYALCNDGTVWELENSKKWRLLPEIPQDNPTYKAFLDKSIDDLRVKGRTKSLSEDEKKELLDLIEQRKNYNLFR